MTGYNHPDYSKSLAEFGTPYQLPRSKSWILKRTIPGSSYYDAMTCYPLFVCGDWPQLHADIEDIGMDLISISLVIDPFGDFDEAYLVKCFNDVVQPYKEHFIVNLSDNPNSFVSQHHRRNAKKALKQVYVERCENPMGVLNEWIELYANLIKRHNISGIQAFSKSSFTKQFSVPGITVFRAVYDEKTVGMMVVYSQGQRAYYHLAAYSDLGYDLKASFALFWFVIEYFSDIGLKWLNLGAGAGLSGDGTDGLSRFKKGWSTDVRMVYFCGRILQPGLYHELCRQNVASETTKYFPAYRNGEFG